MKYKYIYKLRKQAKIVRSFQDKQKAINAFNKKKGEEQVTLSEQRVINYDTSNQLVIADIGLLSFFDN